MSSITAWKSQISSRKRRIRYSSGANILRAFREYRVAKNRQKEPSTVNVQFQAYLTRNRTVFNGSS